MTDRPVPQTIGNEVSFMKLIEPTMEYNRQIQAYRSEFLFPGASMDGGGSLIRFDSTAKWLDHVKQFSDIATVPEGRVPATQFIFVRESDEKVVGVIQIRHFLNEELANYSGHIGYSVAPSERRKGYASMMLATTLPKCLELGIKRVLITCVAGNEGSRRTILKNGGEYESTVYQPERDRYIERYWVTPACAPSSGAGNGNGCCGDVKETIVTRRLRLTPICEKDRGELVSLLTNGEIGLTYMVPDLSSEKARDRVFSRFLELSADPERFVYGIFREDKLVGMIHDVGIEGGSVELGYFISPAEKGKGYATEALSASVRELFSRGFAEVKAAAFRENAASLRVMEKAGLERTGETETVSYRGKDRVCTICSIKNDSRAFTEERINK